VRLSVYSPTSCHTDKVQMLVKANSLQQLGLYVFVVGVEMFQTLAVQAAH